LPQYESGKWSLKLGEIRKACKILFRKPEGKRPLRRSKDRWEDNIRMDCREIRWESMAWMNLAQDRDPWQALMNTVKKDC
jgi:hypothetical protein